jgi:hypothetical protein
VEGLVLEIPEELLNWTRDKAARETLRRGRQVSMNTVIWELIRREMEKEKAIPLIGHECQGYG